MENLRKSKFMLIFLLLLFSAGCIVEENRAGTNANGKFGFTEGFNKIDNTTFIKSDNTGKINQSVNENLNKTADENTNAETGEIKSSDKNTESDAAQNFKTAAARNAELKKSMVWLFGKKNQKGWHLYTYLIQHTLGTEENPDSENFARAVAAWQKKNNLPANGMIDKPTFTEIFKYWQSRRLKSLRDAAESSLLSAPVADFFDPTRDIELLKVERETYAAYKKMVAAAALELNLKNKNGNLSADEQFLKIISSYRSRAYQESLRRREPTAGRAQLALVSPHFTGRALDLYVGGEPVTTRDDNRAVQVETPAYRWLVKNAERFGFYPYFYEPWHWEYVGN